MAVPLPSAQTPLVDDGKLVTTAWFRFFADRSTQTTTDVQTMQDGVWDSGTLDAPQDLVLTAPSPGSFLVKTMGATPLLFFIQRGRTQITLPVPAAGSFIPAGAGDQLHFTFNPGGGGPITIYFLSSGA